VDWYLLGVIIHEMLTGLPPYFSMDKERMIRNIKTGKLDLPKSLSKEVKNLIQLVNFTLFKNVQKF